MPIDIIGEDNYLASLLGLPLDNNNEPVTAAQLRAALKRLIDNDVALERRGRKFSVSLSIFQLSWLSGSFPYVQLFYIPLAISSSQRVRLIQGLWTLGAAAGFQFHIGWGTVSIPFPTAGGGSTPYVNSAQLRNSPAPINHFLNDAGFVPGNQTLFIGVSTTASYSSVSSTPYQAGNLIVDFEVIG
jgi:hypothetical protein